MALMLFREPNQARWGGVRPAHRGTQVEKSNSVTNGTIIVHTVTAGKTLFLCTVVVEFRFGGLAAWDFLAVRNEADVFQYYIARLRDNTAGTVGLVIPYWPPREISAGYDIYLTSSGVNNDMAADIFGWEE
jgi:hypothetical protein